MLSSVQVSLLNYVLLASWAFALPYSHYRPLASSVCTVWTCVIIVCKMLYQLEYIDPQSHATICLMVNNHINTSQANLQFLRADSTFIYSPPTAGEPLKSRV